MQHEKARCVPKHEVKGVRIAPDMDVVLSKFTYPSLHTSVLSWHNPAGTIKTISYAFFPFVLLVLAQLPRFQS